MDFDYKLIEEKLKSLPQEIQEAFMSPDIADKIKAIGNRHDLKLDDESILFDMTGYILLGLIPSNEFVRKFSQQTGVNEKTSRLIADDVNKEIFGHIRSLMQTKQDEGASEEKAKKSTNSQATISSIEQAGGFSIEQTNAPDRDTLKGVGDRSSILAGIENPEPSRSVGMTMPTGAKSVNYTEPMVDHLLKGSVSQVEQKVEQSVSASNVVTTIQPQHKVAPPPANIPTGDNPDMIVVLPKTDKPKNDGYREPID